MHNNNTPGLDGLEIELYKNVPILVDMLWTVYYEVGKILDMMRRGHLILLFKKGDLSDLKNYRHLTMLNMDYKIIAKTMTNRL